MHTTHSGTNDEPNSEDPAATGRSVGWHLGAWPGYPDREFGQPGLARGPLPDGHALRKATRHRGDSEEQRRRLADRENGGARLGALACGVRRTGEFGRGA